MVEGRGFGRTEFSVCECGCSESIRLFCRLLAQKGKVMLGSVVKICQVRGKKVTDGGRSLVGLEENFFVCGRLCLGGVVSVELYGLFICCTVSCCGRGLGWICIFCCSSAVRWEGFCEVGCPFYVGSSVGEF